MSPAPARPAGSLTVVIGTRRTALVVAVLALAALATGCGYFESDEAHLAPRRPLLPPTSESLSAPAPLTPTIEPQPPATGAAPADSGGTAPQPDTAEQEPGEGDETTDGEPAPGEGDETTDGEPAPGEGDENGTGESQRLQIVVIGELLHSHTAFTQGLEIFDGRLYESTGAPADRASSLRELARDTGDVLRLQEITEDIFAEGLTFVDGAIFQLTWQDGVALVWDPSDFSEIDRFSYEGQGWGLCFNGRVLVMSDGSDELHFRDPVSFERVGNPVPVTMNGEELPSLNELECVGELVWANVWQTDLLVQIDPVTGRVLAHADASDLGRPRPDDANAVLNGIAWDPDTETFLITGKDWPAMYEIYFEAAGAPNEDPRRLNP